MSRIRLRAFAYLVAIGLFALGVISLTAVPAWPVLGVAVACAMVAVNRLASRLDVPVCLHCGSSLSEGAIGEHGIECDDCGAVNQPPSDVPPSAGTRGDADPASTRSA